MSISLGYCLRLELHQVETTILEKIFYMATVLLLYVGESTVDCISRAVSLFFSQPTAPTIVCFSPRSVKKFSLLLKSLLLHSISV